MRELQNQHSRGEEIAFIEFEEEEEIKDEINFEEA